MPTRSLFLRSPLRQFFTYDIEIKVSCKDSEPRHFWRTDCLQNLHGMATTCIISVRWNHVIGTKQGPMQTMPKKSMSIMSCMRQSSLLCPCSISQLCVGDGGMRVYKMSSTPVLMCTIRAAVNRLDWVNSMCCDAQHEHVIVGDTGGHVKVWKVDPKLSSSPGATAAACFVQVHWQMPNPGSLTHSCITC